jgi:hypothetical protein
MKTIPAFNGQGMNHNQPAFTTNNAIQNVSPYNMQMPQVCMQMLQVLPQPFFGQPVPNDNSLSTTTIVRQQFS